MLGYTDVINLQNVLLKYGRLLLKHLHICNKIQLKLVTNLGHNKDQIKLAALVTLWKHKVHITAPLHLHHLSVNVTEAYERHQNDTKTHKNRI
jgi:hypothetical protein